MNDELHGLCHISEILDYIFNESNIRQPLDSALTGI